MSKRLRFIAGVHKVEAGEANEATFYVMNTTVNRNGWGVSDKALEEALPTLHDKPLGCGPDYKIDAHYPEPMNVGAFKEATKPDGYALGTATITDEYVWERLISGEWGPISVVINSFRETCSKCGEVITELEDPWSHPCIMAGDGYVLVESFVFSKADFIDVPAYPQAGYLKQAAAMVPLELLAGVYQGHQKESKREEKKELDYEELQEQNMKLQTRCTELEQRLSQESAARENAEERLTALEAERHVELVEEVLEARKKAGLVENTDAERTSLSERTGDQLRMLYADALKTQRLLAERNEPKAKHGGVDKNEFQASVDAVRARLFGPKEVA